MTTQINTQNTKQISTRIYTQINPMVWAEVQLLPPCEGWGVGVGVGGGYLRGPGVEIKYGVSRR